MKKLTKKQQKLADSAVKTLHKLQDMGVEIMVLDGGGGNGGLTFWRPEGNERFEAYEIVSYPSNPKHKEFKEKCFRPFDSIGLRIDCIAI
jgi:hypothetical protein